MAASIASRSFVLAPTTDKYLTLAGEEYLRKLTVGNVWTQLRIGAMVAVTPNATSNFSASALMLGVCTADATFANTLGFSSATTTNYIGGDFFWNGQAHVSQTAAYNANSGNPYYRAASQVGGVRRRVGSTQTDVGGVTQQFFGLVTNTGSVQKRLPIYVDITKGSPNYTVTLYNPDLSTYSGTDFSYADFLIGMGGSTPSINGITPVTSTAQSLACSEVAGNFDTVSLFWNQASFPLEVYAITARQIV